MAIIVNSPETLRQYHKDCAADRRRDRLAQSIAAPPTFQVEHDTEFVGKTVYVPPQLVGMSLTKDDLRLLVVVLDNLYRRTQAV